MNKFTGEIETYLKGLGLVEGHEEILNIMILAGLYCDIYESPYDENCVYYCFYKTGVTFLFEKKILTAVFFYIKGNDEYNSYFAFDKLIDKIKSNITRESFIDFFDEPDCMSETWIKYLLKGNKYLHITFEKNEIQLITIGMI